MEFEEIKKNVLLDNNEFINYIGTKKFLEENQNEFMSHYGIFIRDGIEFNSINVTQHIERINYLFNLYYNNLSVRNLFIINIFEILTDGKKVQNTVVNHLEGYAKKVFLEILRSGFYNNYID